MYVHQFSTPSLYYFLWQILTILFNSTSNLHIAQHIYLMKWNCWQCVATEKWILLILFWIKNVYFWQPGVDMAFQYLALELGDPSRVFNFFNRPWHWTPHIESKIAKKYFNQCIVLVRLPSFLFGWGEFPQFYKSYFFVQCQVFPDVSRF